MNIEVESASLGAGNSGRKFDLETNFRVAEFKFITWRGGSEAVRQNSVFKDFRLLVDYQTDKRKFLYLLGTEHALRFLTGNRALSSVLGTDKRLGLFEDRSGQRFRTVGEHFAVHGRSVEFVDVSPWLSGLAKDVISTGDEQFPD